jgi:type VII secretion-associated serine protease mycosin
MALTIVSAPVAAYGAEIDQWQLDFLRANEAHAISNGDGVTVAVIDSGVAVSHPDLVGSVMSGFNPDGVGAPDGTSDTEGHGTAMALLVAAHGTTRGIAPKATIMPVRASSSTTIARGIDWAVEHGAQVINISLASSADAPDERRAVESALAAGVVIVAGAGNIPGASDVEFPAAYDGVIAVAAVTRTGAHAAVSVVGEEVVLAAPGEDITTIAIDGKARLSSGTSDASALVSGVAALVKAKFPNLSGREIYHRLIATADDKGAPGRDPEYGYGIVNPVRALTENVPPLTESPNPNPDASPQTTQADSGHGGSSGLPTVALVALGVLLLAGLVLVVVLISRRPNAVGRR